MLGYPGSGIGYSRLQLREKCMAKRKGTSHQDQLTRLNRIEGQVRGIASMIDDQRYCIDILTQIKAIKRALSAVESNIIEEHLNHCVHRAIDSRDRNEAGEMMEEIKNLLKVTAK